MAVNATSWPVPNDLQDQSPGGSQLATATSRYLLDSFYLPRQRERDVARGATWHGCTRPQPILGSLRRSSQHLRQAKMRRPFSPAGRWIASYTALATLAGLLVTAPAGAAETFRAAMKWYQQGHEARAFETFEALAHRGDRRAQYMAGLMLIEGNGVAVDRVRGYSWLQISAQGYYGAFGRSTENLAAQSVLSHGDTLTGSELMIGTGFPEVDDATLESVRRWRLKPAMAGGVPVEGLYDVAVTLEEYKLDLE
jgi:hypothetical protein